MTQGPRFVLVIGSDARPDEKLAGSRGDTLQVIGIDGKGGGGVMGIPRDTWAPMPGGGSGKINAAFAYGGGAGQLQSVRKVTGLPIDTTLDAETDALSGGTSTVVLRVVQEALQNVHKHAAASSASVATRIEGADWVVEVTDDGRGFEPSAVAARGRRNYGLQFMRERAELIGAELDVRSRPDGGTVVRLAIPTPG